LGEFELVLEARDLAARSDPPIALPVDPDEDVALADVGGIEVARRSASIAWRAAVRSCASSRRVEETKTRSRRSGVKIRRWLTAGA